MHHANRSIEKLTFTLTLLGTLFVVNVAVRGDDHPKAPPLGELTPDGKIDFNRDIRPILSGSCFACHGPDASTREAELRLDKFDGAIEARDGIRAVVPGKPSASEMIARVTHEDPSERMPPKGKGKSLDAKQVATLKAWIEGGAQYARHWSYVQPARPTVPRVSNPRWVRNPIDAFVLARLDHEGLVPSPEADRATLIRRVSLALTGLPPTIEEVDDFVADTRGDAFERVVDRLLASERYGEHWARKWLDLARYADSAGYAEDQARTIWGYRDWVIQAINENKPFDEFTIEQLAGDLLPNATLNQQIATAFHRNTQTNNEGGTNDEEFRNAAVVDRVNTTFEVFMGTTMACAQCHDHKYDPLSQKEYFEFFAILNQTRDADRNDEQPVVRVAPPEQLKRYDDIQTQITLAKKKLAKATESLTAAQRAWERAIDNPIRWHRVRPKRFSVESGATVTPLEDGSVRIAIGAPKDAYTVDLPVSRGRISAIQLHTMPDDLLPAKGSGYGGGNFLISRITATLIPRASNGKDHAGVDVPIAASVADYEQPGYVAAGVLDSAHPDKSGWSVGGAIDKPHTLTLIPTELVRAGPGAILRLRIEQKGYFAHHTVGRLRFSYSDTDTPAPAGKLGVPDKFLAILDTPVRKRSPEQVAMLAKYYRGIAPVLGPQRAQITRLEKQLEELKPRTTVPVLKELLENQRRVTHIQLRGSFLSKGDVVEPGIPKVFSDRSTPKRPTRLDMAKWIASPSNPLTARVTANRYWEQLFGTGLVETSEEFGSQGALPSHPRLLDWLAIEFVQSGWDVKSLLKTIVMSNAYRQSSRITPDLVEADPMNRLLARGPRFRLTAETIRDQALTASGLLSDKMYGEPVNPPQPNLGLSSAFGGSIDWQTSKGEDRYRRGLYTRWRRTSPYPSMTTFDAPNRQVCAVRRSRTNTPLQALVTLNDPVFIEAAQMLGRLMAQQNEDVTTGLRFGFRRVAARQPSQAELDELSALFQRTQAAYANNPTAAVKMATDPLGPIPQGAVAADLAAWTVVANVLLNLDETLMNP